MIGTLPTPNGPSSVTVVLGTEAPDIGATLGTSVPNGVRTITTPCSHTDLACLISYAPLAQITKDGPCSSQDVFTHPARLSGPSAASLGIYPMFYRRARRWWLSLRRDGRRIPFRPYLDCYTIWKHTEHDGDDYLPFALRSQALITCSELR